MTHVELREVALSCGSHSHLFELARKLILECSIWMISYLDLCPPVPNHSLIPTWPLFVCPGFPLPSPPRHLFSTLVQYRGEILSALFCRMKVDEHRQRIWVSHLSSHEELGDGSSNINLGWFFRLIFSKACIPCLFSQASQRLTERVAAKESDSFVRPLETQRWIEIVMSSPPFVSEYNIFFLHLFLGGMLWGSPNRKSTTVYRAVHFTPFANQKNQNPKFHEKSQKKHVKNKETTFLSGLISYASDT